jgi:hypothetical protein
LSLEGRATVPVVKPRRVASLDGGWLDRLVAGGRATVPVVEPRRVAFLDGGWFDRFVAGGRATVSEVRPRRVLRRHRFAAGVVRSAA